MARMLQALKNLEARGEPVAPQPGAAPLVTPVINPVILPVVEPISNQPQPERSAVESPSLTQVITQLDFATAQLDSLSVSVADRPAVGAEWVSAEYGDADWEVVADAQLPADFASRSSEPKRFAPLPELKLPPVSDFTPTKLAITPVVDTTIPPANSNQAPAGPSQRSLTAIERAAARTLSDPIRSRPLVDLAERLEADIRQSSCHTLLFTGVGASRGNVETLLFVATLLAERRKADVLLVDADLSRRQVSKALACDNESGLSEILAGDGGAARLCVPLATRGVRILAAGLYAPGDNAADEVRIEAMLRQIVGEYSLVLIDGGPAEGHLATTLARHANATYLVVELGEVEAIQAQAALRDLRATGARVLGCIAT